MIDQNRDGFIDDNDLAAMFQQTGVYLGAQTKHSLTD